jgi:hypothetical protein
MDSLQLRITLNKLNLMSVFKSRHLITIYKHFFVIICPLLLPSFVLANEASESSIAYRIQFDNDLLARGGKSDQDYTGGISVTYNENSHSNNLISLQNLRKSVDGFLFLKPQNSTESTASQLGAVFFTPRSKTSTEIDRSERPYASLIFLSNGAMQVEKDHVTFSSLTLGLLGISFASELHKSIHTITGSELPLGYRNQISAGGEPTAKYTLASQKLLSSGQNSDLKISYQTNIGYLTEAIAAMSFRLGNMSTPWWGFNPELNDYIGNATPVFKFNNKSNEFYFFGGSRINARIYNAFLQGQYRSSAHKISASQIEPILFHTWFGLAGNVSNASVTYTFNYQTKEVRSGKAARNHFWGGIQASFDF